MFKGTWDSLFIYSLSVTLAKSLVLRATVVVWPSFHSSGRVGSTRIRRRWRRRRGKRKRRTTSAWLRRGPFKHPGIRDRVEHGPVGSPWASATDSQFLLHSGRGQGQRFRVDLELAAAAGRTEAAAGSERSGRGGRAGRRRRSDSSGLAAVAAASEISGERTVWLVGCCGLAATFVQSPPLLGRLRWAHPGAAASAARLAWGKGRAPE